MDGFRGYTLLEGIFGAPGSCVSDIFNSFPWKGNNDGVVSTGQYGSVGAIDPNTSIPRQTPQMLLWAAFRGFGVPVPCQ